MTWLTISKSVKKAASKGKQTAVAPPKKAKAASKGKGVSTAPPEDKEKASTSKSKGKGAARKNAAEAKTEIGTFLFSFSLMFRLSYMVVLAFLTVVKTEGLVTSSKRLRRPSRKVTGEDPLSPTVGKGSAASSKKPQKADAEPENDEVEEPSTIHKSFFVKHL